MLNYTFVSPLRAGECHLITGERSAVLIDTGLPYCAAETIDNIKKALGDKKIEKDRWTVAEKIISIRSNLKENKKMKFTELFDEDYTKSEMINIFLAVLELLKMQLAVVRQEGIYNDIEIEAREELLNAE